jgi:hypothetical protein
MTTQFLIITGFGLFVLFLLFKYEGKRKRGKKVTGRGGDFDS